MLRIHWEPGRVYTLETLTDSKSEGLGKNLTTQGMKVIQTTTLTVRLEAGTKNRIVEVRFVRVHGEISSAGQVQAFDSNNPGSANAKIQKALGRAIGKSFVLVYDDQDRYLENREVGSLASEKGAVTGLTALADARNVANLFRKSLEMGLPPIAVSPGDTWTADENMVFPQAGDTHVEMNGTFETVVERDGHKNAKIAFEGKLKSIERIDKPTNTIEIGPGSTIAGHIFYDLDRRFPAYGDYTTHLTMEILGQPIPFEQHIVSNIVSIEDVK